MSPKNPKEKDDVNVALPDDFESALRELEQCVAVMERADLSLEASLAAYQRGVLLAQVCQSKLGAAQQKVQVLEGGLLRPINLDQKQESDQ